MKSRRATERVGRLFVSAILTAGVLLVSSGIAEASWKEVARHEELLDTEGSSFGHLIEQSVRQVLSLMLLAVAVLVAIPLFIVGLAFAASHVFFNGNAVAQASSQKLLCTRVLPIDALEFIARVIAQVPQPRIDSTFYYGRRSNIVRRQRLKSPPKRQAPEETDTYPQTSRL